MPVYITNDELKTIARNIPIGEQLAAASQQRGPSGATFLSHSSKDVEYIPAVIRILENHGASVYIDKKDESLPPYTSRETAAILRQRVASCKKFVLFATKNSKDSRWVPWELGLSDGFKRSNNTAVFPSVDNIYDPTWTQQEYLGVYDRIAWGELQGYKDPLWMVWDQVANSAIPLSSWLSR